MGRLEIRANGIIGRYLGGRPLLTMSLCDPVESRGVRGDTGSLDSQLLLLGFPVRRETLVGTWKPFPCILSLPAKLCFSLCQHL